MTDLHTAAKQALEALENLLNSYYADNIIRDDCTQADRAITALRQALAEQPAQEPPAKLKVTLEDRPIDIELAQYKRMFEAACSALGSVGDALGVDPEEGGAEPILAAIAELKAAQQEPVAWMLEWTFNGEGRGYRLYDDERHCIFDAENDGGVCRPLYTRPQASKPEPCTWKQVDDEHTPDTWQAKCGAMWTFTEGGPKDNDMHYCPKCGKPAIEADLGIKGDA